MNRKLISIIIPVYNVELYIRDCIESLINQTSNNFEAIFVDDCGVDKSIEIVKDYIIQGKLQNAFIIRRDRNGGLSAARNTGMENAHGKYFLFLDSDDYFPNNAIEVFSNVLSKKTYDIVVSGYKKIPQNIICLNGLKKKELSGNEIAHNYYHNRIHVTAWNKLVRRKFIMNNKLFFEEGIIHEDILWSFLVMSKADTLCCIKEITYNYRERADSIITRKFGEKNITSLLKILFIMAGQNEIIKDNPAKDYIDKKILEFSLKVYANSDFVSYRNFIQHIHSLLKTSSNVSSIIFRTISILPVCISIVILELLLMTKFRYLKQKR